jgi:hypothetical protein
MVPSLLVHTLKGILRSGTGESTCEVGQRVAGEGRATYYTNPSIVDSSVSPHLCDGNYEFRYSDEPDNWVSVTRRDGFWLNVPPSSRTPN